VDHLSAESRSKVMASIRGQDTEPELLVRKSLWAERKRYRIHDRSVPGTPDLSNKKKRVAVFIDGCFWHGCPLCYKEPTTNVGYWRNKIRDNRERRMRVLAGLQINKWTVFEFWEHQVRQDPSAVSHKIAKKL